MADTYTTVTVTPLDLQVGDKVTDYGAILEVVLINRYDSKGSTVQSNICKLIGSDMGAIPRSYWTSKASYLASGFTQAKVLEEDALYWNVQGNDKARVYKLVK